MSSLIIDCIDSGWRTKMGAGLKSGHAVRLRNFDELDEMFCADFAKTVGMIFTMNRETKSGVFFEDQKKAIRGGSPRMA